MQKPTKHEHPAQWLRQTSAGTQALMLTLLALLMLIALSTLIAWAFRLDVSVIAPWSGTAGLVLLVLAAFWALR